MRLSNRIKAPLVGFVVLVSLLFGVGMTTRTVHAATWHNGTPTALRGTWKTKTLLMGPGIKTKLYWQLGQSYMISGGGPGDGFAANHTSYHHKAGSRYYYVRGREQLYTANHDIYYYRFYKVGRKLKATNYLSYSYGKFAKGYGSDGYVYYK